MGERGGSDPILAMRVREFPFCHHHRIAEITHIHRLAGTDAPPRAFADQETGIGDDLTAKRAGPFCDIVNIVFLYFLAGGFEAF